MTESNRVAERSGRSAYRAGVAVAVVAAFLIVWTTIVRDEGNAIGFFMVIMAVAVGWFAAGFQASGMARTMLGVAAMQASVGALIATAPITATLPDEPMRGLQFSGFFVVLWLVSGAFFRVAAKGEGAATAPH